MESGRCVAPTVTANQQNFIATLESVMSTVTRLYHALPLTPAIVKAINEMDESLGKATDTANAAGVPQGLVVALLQGQAHSQTAIMVN
jgi:hypothetical protein